jgi:hypothetical protein
MLYMKNSTFGNEGFFMQIMTAFYDCKGRDKSAIVSDAGFYRRDHPPPERRESSPTEKNNRLLCRCLI